MKHKLKLLKAGIILIALMSGFELKEAHALSDVAGITLTIPRSAYSVGARVTDVEVLVTGTNGATPRVKVKIGLPSGARLLSPSSNPFYVTGGTPQRITVEMPSAPAEHRFTAVVLKANDTHSRFTTRETVETVRLESVGVYYHADSPYPSTTDQVKVRAMVLATGKDGARMFSREAENNDGHWWATGTDGPAVNTSSTPKLEPATYPQIYQWPSGWPALQKEWTDLLHRAEARGGDRKYWYDRSASGWNRSWGISRTFPRGMIRYRAKVTMYRGITPPQLKVSQDKENATRIAVRDATLPLDPQGTDSLQWMSVFINQPYEYGGQWFGGKTSTVRTGSADTYEDFSIDCSALISHGARWGGYNWTGGWRKTTFNLLQEDTYTKDVSDAEFAPGDILVIRQPGRTGKKHVVACTFRNPRNRNSIRIIQSASGSFGGVNTTSVRLSDLVNEGYKRRRLKRNPPS